MLRYCIHCHQEIKELMGAVLARDILSSTPNSIREICGSCVGKIILKNDNYLDNTFFKSYFNIEEYKHVY